MMRLQKMWYAGRVMHLGDGLLVVRVWAWGEGTYVMKMSHSGEVVQILN
jgi:hypothetical protein